MGRTAYGVRGISLREGDEVVGMEVLRPGGTILTVTENGYGKRTEVAGVPPPGPRRLRNHQHPDRRAATAESLAFPVCSNMRS